MATFLLMRKDGDVEIVDGADTYEQEGPLTTFFQTTDDRRVVDCWSVRLLSVRTADVLLIRRAAATAPEWRGHDVGVRDSDRSVGVLRSRSTSCPV